jgi:hypothetical protein
MKTVEVPVEPETVGTVTVCEAVFVTVSVAVRTDETDRFEIVSEAEELALAAFVAVTEEVASPVGVNSDILSEMLSELVFNAVTLRVIDSVKVYDCEDVSDLETVVVSESDDAVIIVLVVVAELVARRVGDIVNEADW